MAVEQKLHDFLLQNSNRLSESWLRLRNEKQASAYVNGSHDKAVEDIIQDNKGFIENIAKIFVQESVNFSAWSEKVAVKSANTDIPLHETLANFKHFRVILWEVVMEFVEENRSEISHEALGNWSMKINSSFDHVVELFTIYFQQISDARLLSQQQMIIELSAPIIPVFDRIGVLPLVGEIDTYRAQMIKESSLDKCTELKLEHLIIDLSGVPIMDTMVANELFQVVRALSLLGVETTVTGIRPEIAQTAIHLGLDFSNISTYAHLRQALPAILKNHEVPS